MGTTLRLRLRYVPIQYKTNSKKMIIFETKFNLHYTLLGILPSKPLKALILHSSIKTKGNSKVFFIDKISGFHYEKVPSLRLCCSGLFFSD